MVMFPQYQKVVSRYVIQIMNEVKKGSVDAGLLIHEGQLTYASEQLHMIIDFGDSFLESVWMA